MFLSAPLTGVVRLRTDAGCIVVRPGSNRSRSVVSLEPDDPHLYVPRSRVETTLPLEVLKKLPGRVDFAWICDFLARHDDPRYVGDYLFKQIQAYVKPGDLAGRRILDFGCGTGASSFHMARAFPDTQIVGVELSSAFVEIARDIAAVRGLPNVEFHRSPAPNTLPPELGTFDYVMLSAVFEHLLPKERVELMPLLWSYLKDGGLIFINQTPHRYFPYEHHTTGLWLINYLPASLACRMAQRHSKLSPEVNRQRDWPALLRGGIRGGTEREIMRTLRRGSDAEPVIVQPLSGDRASLWLSNTDQSRRLPLKRALAYLFRLTDKLLGTVPSINIDVVIGKTPAR